MNSLSFNGHTDEYYKNIQLLKLDGIYKLNLATHMFKESAIYPNSRQWPNSDTHSYHTRNNLSNIRYNRSKTQSSFVY